MLNTSENSFAHGWYVPAEGQMRQIVSALSIEGFEEAQGFTTLTNDAVYSYSSSDSNTSITYWGINAGSGTVENGIGIGYNRAVRDFPERASVRITVASSNEAMGRGIGTDDYLSGSYNIHIGAKPAQGCHFVQWNDGNTDNPRQIAVGESAATYTATFAPALGFSIATAPCDAAMGSTSGSGSYAWGSTATLEATASAGYRFVRWSDGNTDNPRQITICADSTFTAAFISEDARPVHPGDILCTDGATVTPKDYYAYKNAHNGVSAKGVVYYVDDSGQHGFAVGPHNAFYEWGFFWDEIDLTKHSQKSAIRDMDGAGNTDKHISFYGDMNYAASYCRSFGPEWFWPAAGQLNIMTAYAPEVYEGVGAMTNAGETFSWALESWQGLWSSCKSNNSGYGGINCGSDGGVYTSGIQVSRSIIPSCPF